MISSNIIDLELLLRTPYVESDLGFDISPSGDTVAFSWNKTGTWEIYTIKLHGQEHSPSLITAGPGGKFAPRWRPGVNQLAYVVDMDGGEDYDLYLYDLDSDHHQNLTPDTPFAISPEYAWSPDGGSIAFCADRDGCFDTYVLSLRDFSFRKVLGSSYPDWAVTWSPAGDYLAVVSEATGQDHWLTIVPFLSGEAPWVVAQDGVPIDSKHPCWSADGKALLFSSNQPGNAQIAHLEIGSGRISWVTSGDGEKERPAWSAAGELAYVISHGPSCQIAIQQSLVANAVTREVAPGVVYHPRFDPSGSRLVFIFDNAQHPCDLWTFSHPDGDFRQLTHSRKDREGRENLVMPQEITYPGMDGVPVPALLYLPAVEEAWVANTGPIDLPPAVIYIHGGPNWLTQVTWDPLVQHMVSRGWVVLAPNYRGSTGYGKSWQWANRFDLGGVDTQDVTAGADFLVKRQVANRGRIALTGRSWGGYLTMTCLTQYPNRFAAGSAVVPFLNWFTSHENSRQDLQHWDLQNFGDPVENHKLWHDRSPFFFLDRLQAPVQLICGANDVRCPASESRAAYERLTELGKECDYILYPDEGHVFLQIDNVIRSKKQQVDFLSRYLENDGKG